VDTYELMTKGEQLLLVNPFEALVLFQSVLNLDPDNINAEYYVAQITASIVGQEEEALEKYDNLLNKLESATSEWTDIIISKGKLLLEIDKLDEADECFNKALRVKPNLSYIWMYKARIAGRRQRYAESLEYCENALALNPNDYRALNNKAAAHFHLGNSEQCIIEAKKAITLKPKYAMAWYWMSMAYEKDGKTWKSKRCFKKHKKYLQKYGPFPRELTVSHEYPE